MDNGLNPFEMQMHLMVLENTKDRDQYMHYLRGVIFNHDFAKALWGEPYVCSNCGKPLNQHHEGVAGHSYTVSEWRYHLQQMVIAPDPIKYLGEHLDG